MYSRTFAYFCIIICGLRNILGIRRPNIVIIMADDLGIDDVSFRGAKQFLTPNIDALAYHGKILNRLYVPPMCTPSRAALLTGLYPIHTGTQHFVLSNEDPWGILENFTNMAHVFQLNGYSTNLIGKWHLGMGRKQYTPTYNGFDEHYGYWGGLIDYKHMRSKMPSNFSMGYDFRRNLNVECAPEGSYVTDLLTQEAENVILRQKTYQPLFLMVNHLAPHAANDDEPLQAPVEEIDRFNYIPDERRRTYAAMVSKLDESVGRIVKALYKKDLLKNTIILFYSDNGAPTQGLYSNTGSNFPFRGQKYTPWEGALRVPGIIWSPLLKTQSSIYQPPIYVADFFPTLAAAARIPLNFCQLNIDGLNHWPDLVASTSGSYLMTHSQREIVHMLDDIDQVKSFMQGQYKYISGTTLKGRFDHFMSTRTTSATDPRDQNYTSVIKSSLVSQVLAKYDEEMLTNFHIESLRFKANIKCGHLDMPCNPLQEECLFDILADPCEQNNLARKPHYKTILNQMRNRLEDFRTTTIAPRTGGSSLEYDPGWHGCTWTNFLDDPITENFLKCDYNSPPCNS